MIGPLRILVGLALASVPARAAARKGRAATPVLSKVADVPLAGSALRFDYRYTDTAADRLYLSHMNPGELLVFDVRGRRVVDTVGDLPPGDWRVCRAISRQGLRIGSRPSSYCRHRCGHAQAHRRALMHVRAEPGGRILLQRMLLCDHGPVAQMDRAAVS